MNKIPLQIPMASRIIARVKETGGKNKTQFLILIMLVLSSINNIKAQTNQVTDKSTLSYEQCTGTLKFEFPVHTDAGLVNCLGDGQINWLRIYIGDNTDSNSEIFRLAHDDNDFMNNNPCNYGFLFFPNPGQTDVVHIDFALVQVVPLLELVEMMLEVAQLS